MRGYIDNWRPQRKTVEFLGKINAIITEYIEQLPLTLRQIYYRLVARYDYPKTRNGADNLSRRLTTARRARWRTNEGELLFDVIRDDNLTEAKPFFFASEKDYWERITGEVQGLRLDRMVG
jgi:hypothetical protein